MKCFHSPKLRTIYLLGEVKPAMAQQFRYSLALLLKRGLEPITVEINSEGGDMDSGFAIVDSIRTAPVKITTVATGSAMSSASLILAAGHHRASLKNSTIMVHQGSFKVSGNFLEVTRAELPLVLSQEALFNGMFAKFSNKSIEFWTDLWKVNNVYLTPLEAMEYGLIDEIVEWRSQESQ